MYKFRQILTKKLNLDPFRNRRLSTRLSEKTGRNLFDDDFSSHIQKENITSNINDSGIYFSKKIHGNFDAEHQSIYNYREGGYSKIEKAWLESYFPEGLAGEMQKEFECSGTRSWMIRLNSKILCRILDEYELNSTGSSSIPINQDRGAPASACVEIPGLTDRPPLRSTMPSATIYGKELFHRFEGIKKLKGTPPPSINQNTISKDYIERIKEAHNGGIPTKILISGKEGSGKSTVLNQVVLHARKRGWLVLFIPKGWEQVQDGYYIDQIRLESGDIVYDNPIMSVEVLRGFWKSHSDDLKSLPIINKKALQKYQSVIDDFKSEWTRASSVSGREKFTFLQMRAIIQDEDNMPNQDTLDAIILKGFDFFNMSFETLNDLILFAVAFRDQAGLIFIDLLEELKLVTKFPFLIAIDQYNTWEVPSAFSYEKVPIYGKQLCVPYALNFLSTKRADTDTWQLNNGLIIAATSQHHMEGRNFKYEDYKPSIPFMITMPFYSNIEYISAILHYMNVNRIQEQLDIHELLAYRMHTGSNPKLVRQEIIDYLLPLAMEKENPDYMVANEGHENQRQSLTFDPRDPSFENNEDLLALINDPYDYVEDDEIESKSKQQPAATKKGPQTSKGKTQGKKGSPVKKAAGKKK